MIKNFTIIDIENFINIYTYPVVVVDKMNLPFLVNKKFTQIEKSDKNIIKEKLDNAFKTNEYIVKNRSKDIYFYINRSNVKIEDIDYSLISLFDISIRKKLIKDLNTKQNLFNSLTEQMPEGVVLFDQYILYSNVKFEKLLDYKEKELYTKKFICLIDENDNSIFNDVVTKLSISRKTHIETSVRMLKKNGSSVWTRLSIKRIKQDEKNIFLAVVSDVSKSIDELNKLTVLAYYDKLTGIYNRRKFDELLNLEYKISKRYGRALSALFFDIDHFKKINDTYGHDNGDMVLSSLSALISQQIRETDIFARWGGEEFIILLPETNKENAVLIAQEIMGSLSSYSFPEVGKVTISIGVSTLKGNERLNTFIKRLDEALYSSKKNGRDKFTIL
jgi:diguanylate cyclase (GGDEF)-like protein/PAS domain S-box-containing protein